MALREAFTGNRISLMAAGVIAGFVYYFLIQRADLELASTCNDRLDQADQLIDQAEMLLDADETEAFGSAIDDIHKLSTVKTKSFTDDFKTKEFDCREP